MLSNHIAWRKETGADTIMETFRYDERDSLLTIYPQGYHKTDKMVVCDTGCYRCVFVPYVNQYCQ